MPGLSHVIWIQGNDQRQIERRVTASADHNAVALRRSPSNSLAGNIAAISNARIADQANAARIEAVLRALMAMISMSLNFYFGLCGGMPNFRMSTINGIFRSHRLIYLL